VPTSTPTPSPTVTPVVNADLGATLGSTLSQALQTDSLALRQLTAEAVYLASITANTGAVITTGTLIIVSDTQATYDPNPTDRLHVNLANGRTLVIITSRPLFRPTPPLLR
jgi:hypothetical protein